MKIKVKAMTQSLIIEIVKVAIGSSYENKNRGYEIYMQIEMSDIYDINAESTIMQ